MTKLARPEFEQRRRIRGELYHPIKIADPSFARIHALQDAYNAAPFAERGESFTALKNALGRAGANLELMPPVFFTHGCHTYFGDEVYVNKGLTVLDEGRVTIGSHVFIGPDVSIYTAVHPKATAPRRAGLEYALPVTIEDEVWVGGRAVINPGVTIGRGSIIGSGAVVTHDIPPGVIAAGNPCQVIRAFTDEELASSELDFKLYLKDLCAQGLSL